MCKKFSLFLAIIALISPFCLCANALSNSAKGAILIEADSQDVVFEKNADLALPMASTTKIMTAIVAIEGCDDLDKIVKIHPDAVGIEGSSIYLKEGDSLSVRSLLYAVLLESANDASVALAYATYGDLDIFVEKMNETASKLGLESTHFMNPHGLDDKEHYTTARDLAILARYALKNPVFSEICSTYKHTISLNDDKDKRVLVNHNKLIRMYEGANGVKTGFTRLSGRCLVSSAKVDGVVLICVTLNDPNDWRDHASLFDYGFSLYENVNLAKKGDYLIEIPIINGKEQALYATNSDELSITLKKGQNNIRAVLEYDRLLSAPVSKGDIVGRIVFYNYDEKIGAINLIATENIKELTYKNFFERLFTNGKN